MTTGVVMIHSPGGVTRAWWRPRVTMSAWSTASLRSTSGSTRTPNCIRCGCVPMAEQHRGAPRSISRAPSLAAARMSALAPTATMRPSASSKQMASQTWPAALHVPVQDDAAHGATGFVGVTCRPGGNAGFRART